MVDVKDAGHILIDAIGSGAAISFGWAKLTGLVSAGGVTFPFSIDGLVGAAVGLLGIVGALHVVNQLRGLLPAVDLK